MFPNVDQYETTVGPDGQMILPALLAEALGWRAGISLLTEQTDEGVLITSIEVPGDDA